MFAKLTSTKLTSTRLTSSRVLRQKHSALRAAATRFVAPAHVNDNHASRHGTPAARPVLACRWVPAASGGLECCWFIADGEASRPDEPGGAARERRPIVGGPHLALVAG
jgi:hypothetical protein